jgi:hypothetical protein
MSLLPGATYFIFIRELSLSRRCSDEVRKQRLLWFGIGTTSVASWAGRSLLS